MTSDISHDICIQIVDIVSMIACSDCRFFSVGVNQNVHNYKVVGESFFLFLKSSNCNVLFTGPNEWMGIVGLVLDLTKQSFN